MKSPIIPTDEATIIVNRETTERIRMWPSFETASLLYNWSNLFLLISLAVGVVSTGMLIWMGNVKEEYLKRALAETNERAAVADKAANEAKLKLEMLLKPRTLTAISQRNISEKVSPFAGNIFAVASSQEKESTNLVESIENAFIAAHWKEIDWPMIGSSVISRNGRSSLGIAIESGVTVQVDKSREHDLLPIAKVAAEALTAEGINAVAVFAWNINNNTNTILIVVGTKP